MKLRNSKILRNIHDSSAYDLAAELGIVARIALIDDDILVDFSISKFQNPKPTIVIALNREADEVARWNFTEVESALSTGNGHLKGSALHYGVLRNVFRHEKPSIDIEQLRSRARQLKRELIKCFGVQRTSRVREMVDMNVGWISFHTMEGQLALAVIPDHEHRPWLNSTEFPSVYMLNESLEGILIEATKLSDGRIVPPPYHDESARSSDSHPDWGKWPLYRQGEFLKSKCKPFPVTCDVLSKIASTHRLIDVSFLTLKPHYCLPYHSDTFAFFASCHYGLLVDESGIEVANVAKNHALGQMLAFDDSFFHSAWNSSCSARVVLNAWVISSAFEDNEIEPVHMAAKAMSWGHESGTMQIDLKKTERTDK